ncbi:MAG TPA: ATP-binding cassette domain-containing protein [Solirubrobacteraceae bacterium]|nr:ATP-binding cassette domain-containing protein [Solirubrobacteraceae bacterium]
MTVTVTDLTASGARAGGRETAVGDPHPAAAVPLLSVRRLTAEFGPLRALAGVELTVGHGELVALAGEPGAGKTTLVRCLAGDLAASRGEILLDGRPLPSTPKGAERAGIAVVWQDLALCDNLDVAGNLLLGREGRRTMLSDWRLHARAAAMLDGLGIPIRDTTRLVGSLPGGQRQLLAIARAIGRGPRLLVLDDPTATLGVLETGQVEELIAQARAHGASVLLAGRDAAQMFRLADRIVVLRHGRVVGELEPRSSHPDDLVALQSGQQVDSSARRQLTRLHGLADRLTSADPSSSLSLIISALGAALRAERACIHIVQDDALVLAASLGLKLSAQPPWARLALGQAGGPAGRAARSGERVIEEDLRASQSWAAFGELGDTRRIASSWSVPVCGPSGVSAVITVFRPQPGAPQRDELDLLTLYAGYAASAVERDRLLDDLRSRNRVLETIREVLETLAGPVLVADGLAVALQSLRRGLRADEVALASARAGGGVDWRACVHALPGNPGAPSRRLRAAARRALADRGGDGSARVVADAGSGVVLSVQFAAPSGPSAVLARWERGTAGDQERALIEDAAHSLRLALEREEAALAHQEASALRRSRELQRDFLSRLSHELRTPLTAIRGYASSLLAPDVIWDEASQERFLQRIAAESARLGRLVDDLLDFSAIESGVMRLQPDWCDVQLVIEAAVSCLEPAFAGAVAIECHPELPPVWADHDRLEQVFVNLLSNAFRHNPPGTRVSISARPRAREVLISVADDGAGFPEQLAGSPFEPARRQRSASAGAGLGLSITRGIIRAHGGEIRLVRQTRGTEFRITLPVEAAGPAIPVPGALDA